MTAALLLALLAAPARAADGTVVKVDGPSVYLDWGAAGAGVGARFEVLKPGEELKNPVTGASLGPIWEKSGAGRLTQVEEKYSVGRLDEGTAQPGWKARLTAPAAAAPAPPPAPAATPAPAPAPAEAAHAPVVKSPFFAMDAVDLAVGDVDGSGAPSVVLADAERVEVRRTTGAWDAVCAWNEKPTGVRILSVEARDLDGDGRAEVFVSVHNRLAGAVETLVFDCRGGRLVRRDSLPWLVRGYGEADGTRPLAAQALEPEANFPASGVYRLDFAAGKYELRKPSLKHKRLEWLYGFAFAPAEGEPILLHYNQADRLALRFKKGTWTSPEAFGYGSGKLEWHGSEFEFHPRLFSHLDGGQLKSVYTVRNIPRLVGLAAAFGLYSGAELHRLDFNGLALDPAWHVDLPGMAAGLDVVPAAPGRPERLAVAVVGVNGRTSVWLFDE